MNQLPPPHLFSDPNDRLLASVMPGPPEPLGDRARRRLQQASSQGRRQVRRWLRRGAESTTWAIVALASFGVGIGAYLGVTTRGAPAPTQGVGEAHPVSPEAILSLRANGRSAALDPIPCAAGLAAAAPLVDDVSAQRTPAPHGVVRVDGAPERKLRPNPRRRAIEKSRRSAKLERRAKLDERAKLTAGLLARRATRPRTANAASIRTAQR